MSRNKKGHDCPCCGQKISPVSAITLDAASGTILYQDNMVHLSPLQWELFYLLHEAAPRILSKAYLMDQLYFHAVGDEEPHIRSLDVVVFYMRQKLAVIPQITIVTHFNRGLSLRLALPQNVPQKSAPIQTKRAGALVCLTAPAKKEGVA